MYSVLISKKEDEEKIQERNFDTREAEANKYFNLLKIDMISHSSDDYFDIVEEIKYSDIRISLIKDDEEILYIVK